VENGGHYFPAIAIANALKEIDGPLKYYLSGKGKMEMKKCRRQDIRYKGCI